MNNSPFIVNKSTNDNWVVSWPTFRSIRDSVSNIKLLDILFGEMQCYQVGLAILLRGNEYDTLWIDAIVWYQDTKKQYGDYLESMYEIQGVVFREQHEAEKLQDILEKKYIWKVLKA
jgi:hypothetical protein